MAKASTTAPAKAKNSAVPAGIGSPWMASYDGLFRQAFRYPPYSLDTLLQKKGWQVVEDMLTLSACRAPFNVKRYAVLANGFEVVPAVVDPKDPRHQAASDAADFVRWCVSNIVTEAGKPIDFRSVLFEMARGFWDGFRVSEIGYRTIEDGQYAGRWGYQGFYHKHAKQIGFDLDPNTSEVLHITSYVPGGSYLVGGNEGVKNIPAGYDFKVPIERCLHYIYNQDANLPFGMGDWRACYPHWYALDHLMRFWARSLERWGGPVLIANAPSAGTTLADVAKALNEIRNGGAAALPPNVTYELASAPAGVWQGFKMACDWHAEQIGLNIHSNTLTTGEGDRVGSMALGQVHQDTAETVYKFGRLDIEGVIGGQLFRRLCVYNLPHFDTDLTPRLSLGGDDTGDRLEIAQALQILNAVGNLPGRSKLWRESLGLPPLDPDEEQMLDEEASAEQEAAERLADARNQGPTNGKPLSNAEVERALAILTTAVKARRYVAKMGAAI